jgi:hypothetical protein
MINQIAKEIFIGLLFTQEIYERGIEDIIFLINKEFPQNTLVFEKYIILDNPISIQDSLHNFILKYPCGDRVTISSSTMVLKECSNFFFNLKINVPSFSIGATSSIVKNLSNVLTYAPYDKYEAMSLFMIFKEFKMKQFKILYQENSQDLNIISLINEIEIQGNYLDINIEKEPLKFGKSNYNIKPKTNIIILGDTNYIKQIINLDFLNLIPNDCYISLSGINQNIDDIFGEIPAFVMIPYPIVYNSNTQFVYENIINKFNYYFGVFPLYDILYTLNFFTFLSLNLTLENYLSINPYQDILPAWGYSSASFNLAINGLEFGEYMAIYTKDILIGSNINLFLKWNNGGTLNTSSSFSAFRLLGIIPFYSSKIYYDYLDYFKIYDKCDNLLLTRFYTNDTTYPYNYQNKNFNTGQFIDNKFVFIYNNKEYFSYLEIIDDLNKENPIVNQNMSKYPIIQYI